MTLREFNSRFGLEEEPWIERIRFVTRINTTVFEQILAHSAYPDDYGMLFKSVCYELGEDPNFVIKRSAPLYADLTPPSLRALTNDDFVETLKVLELLRKCLHAPRLKNMVDRGTELALATAATDIGVRWRDGMFYPSGAKELDEKLIGDNLEWLQSFLTVRSSFKTALKHFSDSLNDANARKDAVTNAYAAIEGLSRAVLANKKNFDDNKNDLVKFLMLPKEYAHILHYYKVIANEYSSRHAGSEFGHAEVEGFIYLTGVIMRLVCQKAGN